MTNKRTVVIALGGNAILTDDPSARGAATGAWTNSQTFSIFDQTRDPSSNHPWKWTASWESLITAATKAAKLSQKSCDAIRYLCRL